MKRDIAIFTIVKNEPYFLPKWIEYYSKSFDKRDMYVLDNESTDGSTNNLCVNVEKVITASVNPNNLNYIWITDVVKAQFQKLLNSYNYVFYVDVDEFVISTETPNLRNYLDRQIAEGRKCFISNGWFLIHYPEKNEIGFDYNKSMLSQRQYAYQFNHYDKPFCANYFLDFAAGQHFAHTELPYSSTRRTDPEILLLHAKLFDMEYSVNRYKQQMHMFDQIEPGVFDNDHHWIIKKEYDSFLDYHYKHRFDDTVEHLEQLLHYDYTSLF